MSDYIKREDAYTAIHEQYPHLNDAWVHLVINTIPAADVVERKKGVWLDYGWIKCSECGIRYSLITKVYPNYCPNCGADMRRAE